MQLAIFGDGYTRRDYVQQGFGMIPSWQYSADPGVNIKLNPNVKMPPGWTQTTVQPAPQPQLSGLEVFDSWAWLNRKWLVLGGIGLLGAAGAIGAVALLK